MGLFASTDSLPIVPRSPTPNRAGNGSDKKFIGPQFLFLLLAIAFGCDSLSLMPKVRVKGVVKHVGLSTKRDPYGNFSHFLLVDFTDQSLGEKDVWVPNLSDWENAKLGDVVYAEEYHVEPAIRFRLVQ